MKSAQQAANEKYPPNHPVGDPEGETGTAQSDPYGYDEVCNHAFVEGATWATAQFTQTVKRLQELLAEWELSQ